MYGETFYGRHTAQHQLQWSLLFQNLDAVFTKDLFSDYFRLFLGIEIK